MKHGKFLSTLLVLAILLSCVGWTPSRAEETTPKVQTEQSQAAAQTEAAVYTEQMAREELPEIVAQEAPVNHGHVGRLENEEADNLNQFIFLNQDGSKTMYLYDHPVKYRDEAGNIHDISLNIADTDDTAYPFRTEANWAVTAFPRELANGITLESESAQIKMIPILPENSTTVLNHMARRVDEDTVAYTYDSATQLEYQLTYAGFKEEIVVSEYTGQTEYHFFLYTNGLALTQLDGGYYLTDEAGNIQGTIGDIIVFTADERNNTFGQLQAETVKENGIYLLTIVLDGEYLADPNTQYPIRIDPTININYQYSGSTAIEDTTIHSEGSSDHTLYGLHAGLQQDTGIARILMKFPGLDLNALGTGVTITNATVYLYDVLQQTEPMDIYCHVYPIAWDAETFSGESDFAPAVGQYLCCQTISYDIGATLDSPHYYGFNITAAVRGWLNGTYDQDKGIMFKAHAVVESGETYISKTFASYNNLSKQPILSISYIAEQVGPGVPQITLSQNVADLDEGQTMNLGVSVQTGITVAWQSSDEDVATVTDGLVTAKKAGTVVITATATDSNGNANEAYCTVYVTIPDGIYYITDKSLQYRLQTKDGSITSFTNIVQDDIIPETAANVDRISQMWRITYLADGMYTIRPINNPDMCLYADTPSATDSVPVVIYSSESDEYEEVPLRCQWTITRETNGFVIRYRGGNAYSLQTAWGTGSAGAHIVADTYSATLWACHWNLTSVENLPVGIALYDTDTGLPADLTVKRYIAPEEVRSLFSLGLKVVTYPDLSLKRYVQVIVRNSSLAEFKNNGDVEGISGGETSVYIRLNIQGETDVYDTSFPLVVTGVASGTYYIRNRYSHQYASAETSIGSNVTQKLFVPEGLTSWNVVHTGDGYYTIRSTQSGSQYYLGVKEGDVSDNRGEVVLCSDCSGDNARWKIEHLPDGAYKLTPQSSDYSLALNNSVLVNPDWTGIKLMQLEFTDNDNYEDEWLFCAVSDTMKLEAQETNVWCWAASSRMMVSIFMDSQISQASLAVYITTNNPKIDTLIPTAEQRNSAKRAGTSSQEAAAIDYLLGRDKNLASVTYATDQGRIYSSEVLRRFLDAGYPILINRLTYTPEGTSGHASVIYGYYYDSDTEEYMFTIYDPLTYDEATIDNENFETVAQVYSRSYNWIRDSQHAEDIDNEGIQGRVWVSAVVFTYHEDYRTTIQNTSYH